MLQVCNLTQTLGNKTILHAVTCSFEMGKVTALLGPNGAGKTTLLKTIIGLTKNPTPDAALNNQVIWKNRVINKLPAYERVSSGIAYLPQFSALFHELSVEENLKLIFECHAFWRKGSLSQFNQEADHWLESTDLAKARLQPAGSLSGGQKRKLEVVRSILMHPDIMLCDEPFAGVDPKSIYELKKIFSMLSKEGVGIVISDHHVDQLLSIADTVYVLLQGTVVTHGTTQEVLGNAETQEHYLGKQFHREMSEKFSG